MDYFNNSKNFSKIKDFKALLIMSLSDKKQLAVVKIDLRNRTEARCLDLIRKSGGLKCHKIFMSGPSIVQMETKHMKIDHGGSQ